MNAVKKFYICWMKCVTGESIIFATFFAQFWSHPGLHKRLVFRLIKTQLCNLNVWFSTLYLRMHVYFYPDQETSFKLKALSFLTFQIMQLLFQKDDTLTIAHCLLFTFSILIWMSQSFNISFWNRRKTTRGTVVLK